MELLNWIAEMSNEKRDSGAVNGQLRIEKVEESALIILLSASLSTQHSADDFIDYFSNQRDFEVVDEMISPIDGTSVPIYSTLKLHPREHVIYDTRMCILHGLPDDSIVLMRSQTSALKIGSQLTAVFKKWVEGCEWSSFEAMDSK
jgi:hypothetical protein